jgi:hypothetical protein
MNQEPAGKRAWALSWLYIYRVFNIRMARTRINNTNDSGSVFITASGDASVPSPLGNYQTRNQEDNLLTKGRKW